MSSDSRLLQPDFFYDHGRDPALKELMYIMAANSTAQGGIKDYRTLYKQPYGTRRFIMAKNMEEFFINSCMANTVPRTWIIFSGMTGMWLYSLMACEGFLPRTKYGITNFKQMNTYKIYGRLGLYAPLAVAAVATFTWYRAACHTFDFTARRVLYGERDWMELYAGYNDEYGDYAYSDHHFFDGDFSKTFSATYNMLDEKKNAFAKEEIEK